jgi:hypothetical protein
MAYDFNTPQASYTDERLSFFQVWIRAVTQPKPETFQDLANRPDATLGRAYLWIFLVTMVTYIIGAIVNIIVTSLFGGSSFMSDVYGSRGGGVDIAAMIIPLICGAPIAGLAAIVGSSINAGLVQLIAKMLGGTGNFTKMLYANACYGMPISLIIGLLAFVPFVGPYCIAPLVGIYAMVLLVMAIKGVNGFGYGAAIGTLAILWVAIAVIAGCCAVIVVGLLSAMGPAIRDIFQNIQDSIHLLGV